MTEDLTNPNAPPAPRNNIEQKSRKGGYATGVVILLALGVGIWWTFLRPRAETSASPASTPTRTVLPLESFTVNLADEEDGRFLRATIALGVDGLLPQHSKIESKEPESGTVSMATIRDSILSVLAQSKSSDLLTPDGKTRLKANIIESLNRDVPELQAREVYFMEFLVQR